MQIANVMFVRVLRPWYNDIEIDFVSRHTLRARYNNILSHPCTKCSLVKSYPLLITYVFVIEKVSTSLPTLRSNICLFTCCYNTTPASVKFSYIFPHRLLLFCSLLPGASRCLLIQLLLLCVVV